jgi:hypothetical protein
VSTKGRIDFRILQKQKIKFKKWVHGNVATRNFLFSQLVHLYILVFKKKIAEIGSFRKINHQLNMKKR